MQRRNTPNGPRAASRRRFLLGGAVAGAALATLPLPTAGGERACCPARIAAPPSLRAVSGADLAGGNAAAIAVARRSRLAMAAAEDARALAANLPEPTIRARTLALLDNPAPTYQLRAPSTADREAVRQELLAEGLIPPATTLDGIYPPVADPHEAPQPFWSAPGSSYGAHHGYPGGLALHELVFARTATHYRETYARAYAVGDALDPTLLTGVSLWHDIHKVSVFQWLPDGSEVAEQVIADTGAHHILSGAEAIVRGMTPAWVTTQLSAHDAPTTVMVRPGETGRFRVVQYLRAAAIVARVDPVAAGLLRRTKDGGHDLAQDPPAIEDFIINFADGDYLFTNDAAPVVIAGLGRSAVAYGIDPVSEPARFNLFRNLVLSQISEVRLYAALRQGGDAAARHLIDEAVDLEPLRGA